VELYNIELSNLFKALEHGFAGLLKIEDIPVFILPNE